MSLTEPTVPPNPHSLATGPHSPPAVSGPRERLGMVSHVPPDMSRARDVGQAEVQAKADGAASRSQRRVAATARRMRGRG